MADHIAGIVAEDVRAGWPVAISSTGHSKVMVPLRSVGKLHSLSPDMTGLARISAEIGCGGYYAFTFDPQTAIPVHGRMFAPAIGIAEDPVTGNANGPLGAYLVHFGLCRDLESSGSLDFSIVQGEAIARPGTMRVHVAIRDGEPELVQIAGSAVAVFRTEIEAPEGFAPDGDGCGIFG